jgi:hypothetical protein
LTDYEGQLGDNPVDRRAQDGSVEVELSRRAVGDRLLIPHSSDEVAFLSALAVVLG